MELDWYLQHFVTSTRKIDYGISEIKGSGNTTTISLERYDLMPMPLDVVITKKDGTVHMHNIPMVIMRGEKTQEDGYDSWTIEEDWAWTNPVYSLSLDIPVSDIAKIDIDTTSRLADVNPSNNSVNLEDGTQFMYKYDRIED